MATRKKRQGRKKQIQKILGDLYYSPNQPAAFGGAGKLVQAAKKYGIKKATVLKWLQAQGSYSIHKPIVRKFKENRVIVNGKDEQWQADLVDVQRLSKSNNGYKYILTCIDVLSKYAWAIPLKNKTGTSLVNAFKQIFKDNRKPEKLQADKGTEFTSRILVLARYFQAITTASVLCQSLLLVPRTCQPQRHKFRHMSNLLKIRGHFVRVGVCMVCEQMHLEIVHVGSFFWGGRHCNSI